MLLFRLSLEKMLCEIVLIQIFSKPLLKYYKNIISSKKVTPNLKLLRILTENVKKRKNITQTDKIYLLAYSYNKKPFLF